MLSTRPTPSPARALGLLLAVALATGLWVVFRHFTVDDAFIAYRHARNFGRGLGPVMNPGDRVEGVSNLPWTLLLGLFSAVGLAPDRLGPLLSALCGLACVPLTARVAARVSGDPGASIPAALLCAAGLPLVIWSASGMETPAVALLLLVLLENLSRLERTGAALGAGLALGGIAALRPEGILFALPVALAARRGAVPGASRVRLVLGAAAILLALGLFRILYYGDWLPNPARAKAPDGWAALGPGLVYVAKTLASFPIAFAAIGMLARVPRRDPVAAFMGAATGAQLAFIWFAGGDHFAGYRFAAPLWPILALAMERGLRTATFSTGSRVPRGAIAGLAAAGLVLAIVPRVALPVALQAVRLQRLHLEPIAHTARLTAEARHLGVVFLSTALWGAVWRRWGPMLGPAGAFRRRARLVLLLVVTLAPAWFDPQIRICTQADAASRYGRPVGEWLAAHLPPGACVATNAAGSLPYFADLPVIDMLGLTDRAIARRRPDVHQWVGHERGDGAYVLSRRPAVIIFGGPEGSLEPWPFPGDQQLAADPEFHRLYGPQRVALPGFEFIFYSRRDLDLGGAPRLGGL